jgi:uroporphyrin-III C-methyltransferase
MPLPFDQSNEAQSGHVYLAGAGPGDPNLLTVRAVQLLQTADVILPDDLVSDEILALASPTALIIPVGKRCGQPRITQAEIHELMLEHAGRNGHSVLRLKSGDPLIFGRAGEEIAFLREHNLPFEIVPGITTAFAVAAALKTPLTDRAKSSKLILATAHHAAGKVELTPSWNGAVPPDSTLVIYMPGRDFETLAGSLISAGIPPETPCAAISKASTTDEHIHTATLSTLASEQVGPAPVILLIGAALRIG